MDTENAILAPAEIFLPAKLNTSRMENTLPIVSILSLTLPLLNILSLDIQTQ